jgi:AcrR family transcriptional regulator
MVNEARKLQNVELALSKATELALTLGIEDTTKEMVARECGLSRKSIDRYFADKPHCMLQVAHFIGNNVWNELNARYGNDVFSGGEFTGAELLERYMNDIKSVFIRRPNLFIFYMEFKIYLYHHSKDFKKDYSELVETIGCRRLAEGMFALGLVDGSLHIRTDVASEAEYFCRSFFSFLSNMAITYKDENESAIRQIDRYMNRVMKLYRRD